MGEIRPPIFFHRFFVLILVCEVIGTAATPGLLCQPRVIVKMIVEKQMECRLAGETEVLLGENLPQRHFCPSQNPTWPNPGLNPGRRGGKPATNRLSYGAVFLLFIYCRYYLIITDTVFPVMFNLLFLVIVCVAARFIWIDKAGVPHTARVSSYDPLIGSPLRGIMFHL
jgi:hypothetical protein